MLCFNPCSLGCCSERVICLIGKSLCFLFQSLFSWMLLWKRDCVCSSAGECESFNPCSLGCCSERCRPYLPGERVQLGFNPCSLGCCSERPNTPARPPWILRCFNPCSLGCCSERHGNGCRSSPRVGVSILVLLDVALKAASMISISSWRLSFNPCSLGCCSERCKNPALPFVLAGVSILVLLDVALKGVPRSSHRPQSSGVSILVLLDVALKGNWYGRHYHDHRMFQSLFSWMLLWKRDAEDGDKGGIRSFNPCSLGCCSERLQV